MASSCANSRVAARDCGALQAGACTAGSPPDIVHAGDVVTAACARRALEHRLQ
jgi:hypothetical protein